MMEENKNKDVETNVSEEEVETEEVVTEEVEEVETGAVETEEVEAEEVEVSSETEVEEEMSMEEAMEEISIDKLNEGDIIEGKILKVDADEIVVDINHSSDGVVKKKNLTHDSNEDLTETFTVGDVINVMVLDAGNGEDEVKLSKLKADGLKAKERVLEVIETKEPIEVKVNNAVKGGLRVTFNGLRGFMPASLVSNTFIEDFKQFEGKTLKAIIIEFSEEENRLIFSRKEHLLNESKIDREKLFETLKAGDSVEGVVSNLTNYGAFIDLGGATGLAHIKDLSYKRINHPEDILKKGDKVTVHVLDIDKESERISLSLKDKKNDPWNNLDDTKVGAILTGKVKKILDIGAIVQIPNGLEGLVHVSEISKAHVNHPKDVLSEGEEVEVKILKIEPNRRRISLSIKEAKDGEDTYQGDSSSYYEEDSVTIGDVFEDLLSQLKDKEDK